LFGIFNDIAMQVVGVGFIDVLFTAAAEFAQWKKEGRPISVYPNAK